MVLFDFFGTAASHLRPVPGGACCCSSPDIGKDKDDGDPNVKMMSRHPDEEFVEKIIVAVDRSEGDDLGLEAYPTPSDGTLEVKSISKGGLLHAWNRAHKQRIPAGAKLLEVDGLRGDHQLLIEACKKRKLLNMTFVIV
eukprot:TRINITY_DN19858_c0_g1_i1.p2 TRINITY_DN19858_c0_g1~~TRINITY_DN19858_c0_g1_i1.p2  ORF type:complete len:139 (+),score=33.14 TRINITY_DN19858_c0_g1_i1:59-475(+)